MHLLHLGAHCLNAAQDLVLVGDGSDPNPCQVTVESKRRSRVLRTMDQMLVQREILRVNHKQHSKSEADVQKCLIK